MESALGQFRIVVGLSIKVRLGCRPRLDKEAKGAPQYLISLITTLKETKTFVLRQYPPYYVNIDTKDALVA